MITPDMLHYIGAMLGIAIGALGSGVGLGIAGAAIQEAQTRQPAAENHIFKTMIIGLSLIESGAIISLVVTLLLLFGRPAVITWEIGIIELAIGSAIGIAAGAISIASSLVVKASSKSIARQPLFANKFITFMLITQSIIEAPIIFTFIVGFLMHGKLASDLTMEGALAIVAAAIVMAVGCIGPAIGQAIFAQAANEAVGRNKDAYAKIFTYTIVMQGFIETPIIFCLLFALIMLYGGPVGGATTLSATKSLVAALCMGIASIGSAAGIGYVGSKGCYQLALEPSLYSVLIRTTLLSAAFIESTTIYAFIIGMLLLIQAT
jgi:F-type H+-transporting ATPase subunit c